MIKNTVPAVFAAWIILSLSSSATAQKPARDAAEQPTVVKDAVIAAETVAEAAAAAKPLRAATPPMRKIARRPRPVGNIGDWLRLADHPPKSFVAGEEGAVKYELAIDATGAITGCKIVKSSDHPRLDETTCRLVTERGQFKPATDKAGKAVKGIYSGRKYWRIREQQFQPMAIEVAFTVGPDGLVKDCDVIRAEGDVPKEFNGDNPCPRLGRYGQPFRDDQGHPVERRVNLQVISKFVEN